MAPPPPATARSILCGMPVLAYIVINIGSGNVLLPDGTKPSPEAMLALRMGSRVGKL